MLTYKFIVRESRSNNVRLRLTSNRRNVEVSVGLRLSEDTLADALSTRPRPENLKWRSVLTLYQSKVDEIACEYLRAGISNPDLDEVKRRVLRELFHGDEPADGSPTEGTFLKHFQTFTSTRPSKRTREIYASTMSRMKSFEPRLAEMAFEDVTVEWLAAFDAFLAKKAPMQNARNIHFRNIRAVIKDAYRADLTTAHPFDRFRHSTEETPKRSLSVESLRRLFAAEVDPSDRPYLDFFKFSFMLMGANVIDICTGCREFDGRIEYRRSKTKKLYSIKIEPETRAIMDAYPGKSSILGITEGYADYRYFYIALSKSLHRIGERLGLPGLTTYWARHTWATIAAELDVPDAVISQALGHSGANRTTEIYIRRNHRKVDTANRRVLDYVLYDIGAPEY